VSDGLNSRDTAFEEIKGAGSWLRALTNKPDNRGVFFLRRFAAVRSGSLFLEGK
jgi:hypothetical protein